MNKRQGIVVFVTFALYLVIGGSVFMTLENSNEEAPKYPFMPELQGFMALLLTNGTINSTYTTNEMWNDHVMAVYDNYTDSLTRNQTVDYWTFYDAFFMCLTVVTTIGYGNISPRSGMGRVFCVLYGFIGIPIAGILFAGIGDFFSNVLLEAHEKYKTTRSTPLALLISTVTYLIPGLLLFLFLPAGIFMILEDWSYLEGFYYAFITLTTIGFGDYVAGIKVGETQWIYKLGLMAWIIFGLGYLSMILNFIAKAMKSKQVKKIEKTVARNIKQTHEVLTKEMEYFMKSMNDFYMKKVKSKPDSLGKLKRTSSCPSLERPVRQRVRKSISTRSINETTKSEEYSGQAEASANFILDLAMALACGEMEQRQEADVMSSRKNSIAQLLTMALVPPAMRSNSNVDANFSRSSTRKSMSPFSDFLLRGSSFHGKTKGSKKEKSQSLLDGLLFPMGLGASPSNDCSKKYKSDIDINKPVTTSAPSGVKNGPVITRSVSNPASLNYVDKFVESGKHQTKRSDKGDSRTSADDNNRAVNAKCTWILGASSLEDTSGHKDNSYNPPVQQNQGDGPSSTAHRGMSECEIPSVIEEEKSDCESDLSASGTNLSDSACSSDQGISSQETIALDIDRCTQHNIKYNNSYNTLRDLTNGRITSTSCFIDVDCENNNDFSTRM